MVVTVFIRCYAGNADNTAVDGVQLGNAVLNVADDTVMLSVSELDEAAVCATGNIANMVLRRAVTVNVYELLRFKKIIFTKDALDAFIGRLA